MPQIELAYPAPHNQGTPCLHTPSVYGASPNKPFSYAIPATGERPLRFACTPELPQGLSLDPDRGMISGTPEHCGKYTLTIRASNRLGKDARRLTIQIAEDGLCRTPLLGWTSWNAFGWHVDQEKILQAAHALVDSGLACYGYQYVNIDSSWQGQYGGPCLMRQHDAASRDGRRASPSGGWVCPSFRNPCSKKE